MFYEICILLIFNVFWCCYISGSFINNLKRREVIPLHEISRRSYGDDYNNYRRSKDIRDNIFERKDEIEELQNAMLREVNLADNRIRQRDPRWAFDEEEWLAIGN